MQVSKEIEYIGFCLLKAVIFNYSLTCCPGPGPDFIDSSLQTTAQSDNASVCQCRCQRLEEREKKFDLFILKSSVGQNGGQTSLKAGKLEFRFGETNTVYRYILQWKNRGCVCTVIPVCMRVYVLLKTAAVTSTASDCAL